jgi:hypothetical protein
MLLHLFEFGPFVAPLPGFYFLCVPDWTKIRRRDFPYYFPIKNVDIFELYPSFPGYPVFATLEFHYATFQIYGDALIVTLYVGKVTFAKSLLQLPIDKEQRTEQIIAVLRELFPKVPDAITHILTAFVPYQSGNRFSLPESGTRKTGF